MKYPQLVSTRAVNAISDWLVSRLEQLGVESAQIYTRLLLSLLQSSVQINDPIEFTNLETYFLNRKGIGSGTVSGNSGGSGTGAHHYNKQQQQQRYNNNHNNNNNYFSSDAETLKKLNAVQCLREIVSAEYETIYLEQLVDELYVKLNEFEKQQHQQPTERFILTLTTKKAKLDDNSNDERQITSEILLSSSSSTTSTTSTTAVTSVTTNKNYIHNTNTNSNNNNNNNHLCSNNDQDNDPKRRYFRAFPALTKEMEESFLLWRRNAKTLTWPIIGNIVNENNNDNNNIVRKKSKSNDILGNHHMKISKEKTIATLTVDDNTTDKNGADDAIQLNNKSECIKKLDNHVNNISNNNNQNKHNIKVKESEVMVSGIGTTNLKRRTRRRRHNHQLYSSQSKGRATSHLRATRDRCMNGGNRYNCCDTANESINSGNRTTGQQQKLSHHKYHQNHNHHQRHNQYNQQHYHYNHNKRYLSPSPSLSSLNQTNIWDTDFKGCWEMGPDLIEEFLSRQNIKSNDKNNKQQRQRRRRRCYTTSDNYNHEPLVITNVAASADDYKDDNDIDDDELNEVEKFMQHPISIDKLVMEKKCDVEKQRDCCSNSSAMTLPNVDISFFSDDDNYDDDDDDDDDYNFKPDNKESHFLNLPYENEIDEDNNCVKEQYDQANSNSAKRLYERECPPKIFLNNNSNIANDNNDYDTTDGIFSNIINTIHRTTIANGMDHQYKDGPQKHKRKENDNQDSNDEEKDIAEYEAKFHNKYVQSLWKDSPQNKITLSTNYDDDDNSFINDSKCISSAFYASASLNALAPFKHDLWNFWSNYHQQQQQQHQQFQQQSLYDNKLSSATSISSMVTTRVGDSGASSGTTAFDSSSATNYGGSGGDFFSMPANFENFDKSVGAMRRHIYNNRTIDPVRDNFIGDHIGWMDDGKSTMSPLFLGKNLKTPTGGVFLQNSIWSSSGDYLDGTGAVTLIADTDESFLYKVWQSNKKLNQIDPDNDNMEKLRSLNFKERSCDGIHSSSNSSNGIKFSSYTSNLKWSEGINAPSYDGNLVKKLDDNNAASGTFSYGKGKGANLCCMDNNFETNCCHSLGELNATNCIGAKWHIGKNLNDVNGNRPDLYSWSAANPTSLTEMYGNGSSGGIGLDVCDSIISTNSEGGEDNNVSNGHNDHNVTLPNHCKVTSGFIAYSRIKQYNNSIMTQLQLPSQQQHILPLLHVTDQIASDLYENENIEILGSASGGSGNVGDSHFHPIELYEDGHSFEINNALDVIEYEHGKDGYLCYKGNKYLTYKRDGVLLSNVGTTITTTTTSSRHQTDDCTNAKSSEELSNSFSVKFRVLRHCEKECQTDDKDFKLAAELTKKITSTSSSSQATLSSLPTFGLRRDNEVPVFCDQSIIKAVSKAVKSGLFTSRSLPSDRNPNASFNDYRKWLSSDATDEVDFSSVPSICSKTLDKFNGCDADCKGSRLTKNWSMKEIEKQCKLRSKQTLKIDKHCCSVGANSNEESNSYNDIYFNNIKDADGSTTHTLWGVCSACNVGIDNESLPANDLMRDELRLEADEIMSDLRYMQDLYIGSNRNDCNDSDEMDTETNDDNNHHHYNSKNYKDYVKKSSLFLSSANEIADNMECVEETVFKKVNKLIEHLLKPSTLSQEASSTSSFLTMANNRSNNKDNDKMKWMTSNWLYKEENNIAQEKIPFIPSRSMKTSGNSCSTTSTSNNNIWQYDGSNEQLHDVDNWPHNHNLSKIKLEYDVSKKAVNEYSNSRMDVDIDMLNDAGNRPGIYNYTYFNDEEEKYLAKLNSEHESLSKIWQECTPPPSPVLLWTPVTAYNHNDIIITTNEIVPSNNNPDNVVNKKDNSETANCLMVERKNLKNLQSMDTVNTTEAATTYRRLEEFLNAATSLNRIKCGVNRKRRHSASQNMHQQQFIMNNNNNNNNNSANNMKRNGTDDLDGKVILIKNQSGKFMLLPAEYKQKQEQQPIVSCKYWTKKYINSVDMCPMVANSNGMDSETAAAEKATAMMLLTAAAANSTASSTTNDFNTNPHERMTSNELFVYANGNNIDGYDIVGIKNNNGPNGNDDDDDDDDDGNRFSRLLIEKGTAAATTTILKQVAILTRPLTR